MDAIDRIREKLHPIFVKECINSAVLFGSFAKGVEQENSDVDIVIDSNGVLVGLDFYRVLDEFVRALDCQVDLFDKSEIVPDSPVQKRIQSEGVLLYERKWDL